MLGDISTFITFISVWAGLSNFHGLLHFLYPPHIHFRLFENGNHLAFIKQFTFVGLRKHIAVIEILQQLCYESLQAEDGMSGDESRFCLRLGSSSFGVYFELYEFKDRQENDALVDYKVCWVVEMVI